MKTQVLQTAAGHTIGAQIFPAQNPASSKGVCIIATATGVAQRLYKDFANWLAEQNYTAVSFDYDGIGLSIDGHVKNSKSDKLSWGKNDCPAVLEFVKNEYPNQEIIWIGHSVGAHMLGFMENTQGISKAITVGAGTGTWWYNSPPTKRIAWFLWYFLVPATTPFLGYFPGDKIGIMCDLPKGVIMQWRRWCLNKDYSIGCEGNWLRQRFANVTIPMTGIAFSDDDMMSMKNVEILHSFFTGAEKKMITVTPEDIGQKRIGHIGWHKARYRKLWEDVFLPALQS